MQTQDVDRVHPGSPVNLVVEWSQADRTPDTPQAALVLARRRMTLRGAHAALTRLIDVGWAVVEVPMVESVEAVIRELAATRIRAAVYRTPERVNPTKVRERLHLTQEQFALAFGLDTATLRNWEQGLSEPAEPHETCWP